MVLVRIDVVLYFHVLTGICEACSLISNTHPLLVGPNPHVSTVKRLFHGYLVVEIPFPLSDSCLKLWENLRLTELIHKGGVEAHM